eukprot:660777-Pyramimonas_sp.AAC.1
MYTGDVSPIPGRCPPPNLSALPARLYSADHMPRGTPCLLQGTPRTPKAVDVLGSQGWASCGRLP